MGYLHISNLYKDQTIMLFKECYALEKVHGCLKKGTKVRMADNYEKPIEEVVEGDSVLAYDEKTQAFVKADVDALIVRESDSRLGWMEVVLENGRILVCTVDHPFLTKNRGWVPAEELLLSDDVLEVL